MLELRQRGDTIIEVLIAVIVLSFVLTTAYALATRSIKDDESAQEHSQALKIAQGQLESMRSFIANGGSLGATPPSSGFCFNLLTGAPVTSGFAAGEPTAALPDTLDTSHYPTGCTQALGTTNTCSTGLTCYYIGFRQTNNVYTVSVRWPGLIQSQEQVSLVYRFYQ